MEPASLALCQLPLGLLAHFAHRPWQLYRAVFEALLVRCQPLAQGRRKFRFKNKLV